MNWWPIFVILGLLGYASFRDIKERVIPNWLSLCLAVFGLGVDVLGGFMWLFWYGHFNFMFLVLGPLGGLILFGFGFVLYSFNVIADGDMYLLGSLGLFFGYFGAEKWSALYFIIGLCLGFFVYGLCVKMIFWGLGKKIEKVPLVPGILIGVLLFLAWFILRLS